MEPDDASVQSGTADVISDNRPSRQQTSIDVLPAEEQSSIIDESETGRLSAEVQRSLPTSKRKSDEISRDGEAPDKANEAPPLSTKKTATTAISEDDVRRVQGSRSTTEIKSPSRYPAPQNSPVSARTRNRGMSLRSSLFARNIDWRSQPGDTTVEMQRISFNGAFRPSTSRKDPQTTVTVEPARERLESRISEKMPAPGRLLSPKLSRKSSSKGVQGVLALPNYQQWVQKQVNRRLPVKRIKGAYNKARKFVLQIQDMPPSKDGRRIPVDPSRKIALIDDRTGHAYVNNFIKSSKYTVWNFLPRQLYAQFSKLANFYFLSVSILQMIPGLSTTGQYTTIIPLMFFVSLSMAKEGYEDLRRHRLDKVDNNREASVLLAYRPAATATGKKAEDEDSHAPIHWAAVKWQSLQVGDIVKLERDEAVPADLLLLDSKGDNGIAHIETMALDGETNLKSKQPSGVILGSCKTPDAIAGLENTDIVVEDPNLDLYNFEGKILVGGGEPAPLTNSEIIYRGSILRNTPEAIGMIIYSGEECKIRMNANKNPRIKAPSLQTMVNKIVMMMVIFVVALSVFNSIGYEIWSATTERKSWYLTSAKVPFGPILTSFIIMFNTLIPLSLYVSLEIIKLAQMYLLNDIDMYDEVSKTPFEARTSTINEELGQVSYVFSDKTGTLTDNVMRFRKLSVAGTAWLHDADLKNQLEESSFLLHKKTRARARGKSPLRKGSLTSMPHTPLSGSVPNLKVGDEMKDYGRTSNATPRPSSAPNLGELELSTGDMIRYIQRKPHTSFARKTRMMILSMALCHTCLPERGGDDQITYQASSPDELALVQAAGELGYLSFDREGSILTLKTYPNGMDSESVLEKYEILEVVEFSSKRARMSVVVRMADGRICIICKGADSFIMERLRLADLARQKVTEIEKRVDERRGVGAQQALTRKSSTMERQSNGSHPRPSLSLARPSIGGTSIGRLRSIRHDVDGWLDEQEYNISTPVDASHYSPRPSAQISRRSAAISEHAKSLHSEEEDEALVEESLVTDDSVVVGRCFQHIHDYALQGLRTLLYGYRFLDEEEYRSWKKVYQDATTSLVDRQQLVEQAGELIEKQLELGGATAIEDKLQKGVPETIDRLRRANIKLWMLTGDKRETAINIGHSCRLIKDYSSVTILDHEAGDVERSIATAILDINGGNVAHAVIVIDGRTLGRIHADENLHVLFLDLAILADSVICCRASPSQKSGLVHAIRRRVNRSVTLSIGDGANDIAMIQEAHVGIGITGKEGLQAARVSDYSIAQFRFLNKLLLVHGRWNYIRTAKYTVATFWKELLFYLTQALYQRWNGYTGTSLYEQWSLSQFNTLFTSLPVIFLGIFEKDLAASTLIAVPELYTKGQRFAAFNFKVYLSWMFMAASEAVIVFFTMRGLFGQAIFTSGKDLYAIGTMTFSACIIVINSKCQLLEQHNRTIIAFLCMFIEVGGWFLWNVILSVVYGDNNEYDVKGGLLYRFGENALWWLALILSVASCILFEILVRAVKNAFAPTDVEIFQELEKDRAVRRRFEEASAPELQAGWNHGTKKLSLELQREAEREGEIQDLLTCPRVMEEGRSDSLGKSAGVETEEHVVMVDDGPTRRSTDIQEMLSPQFGSIKRESLTQP